MKIIFKQGIGRKFCTLYKNIWLLSEEERKNFGDCVYILFAFPGKNPDGGKTGLKKDTIG